MSTLRKPPLSVAVQRRIFPSGKWKLASCTGVRHVRPLNYGHQALSVASGSICFGCVIAVISFTACSSSYNPLTSDNARLRGQVGRFVDESSAVKVTFLGNTTLLVQDGRTTLLVDGFVSRPNLLQTAVLPVGSSYKILKKELYDSIPKVHAVLVGHAHHDHALDATAIADYYEAEAIGSASFAQLYQGSRDKKRASTCRTIGSKKETVDFGENTFKVDFVPSTHVAPESLVQRLIEGEIDKPLKLPAYWTRFDCGTVFSLRIRHPKHPNGDIVVTTTVGSISSGLASEERPAVLFLAVGYLSKADTDRIKDYREQKDYWRDTVVATNPRVIVPTHWDDFTRPLSKGLRPPPLIFGDAKWAMEFVKDRAGSTPVRVLDLRESVYIRGDEVYIPEPVAPVPSR